MQTYLTPDEFVKLIWDSLDRKMSNYNRSASQCDSILWYLFQKFEKDIKETLEGAMWNIDEYEGKNANELIGYQFHKSFRQTDVIDSPCIDSVIWSCMQDAPVFWQVMERACKILTNKDIAEIYKEDLLYDSTTNI